MTKYTIKHRKKLIETCIPLAAINEASIREKSIKHSHPSALHLWWSRKPLAAARAILICQLVDDPSDIPEDFPDIKSQDNERNRIFALISKTIEKENLENTAILEKVKELIDASWRRFVADNSDSKELASKSVFDRPPFLDPFSGGGSIPLEASRLGITPIANDLSPVATLINKAMIEIPQKFHNLAPISSESSPKYNKSLKPKKNLRPESGLQEDVLFYGKKVLEKCKENSAGLYASILISEKISERRPDLKKYLHRRLTPIAYIWARTVKSPSPAFHNIEVPLVSGLHLSRMKGQQTYIKFKLTDCSYKPTIAFGEGADFLEAKTGTKLSRGANFKCIMSGDLITPEYIKKEGSEGRMGQKLLAVVCEGDRERVYLDAEFCPDSDSSLNHLRKQKDGLELPGDARNFWTKDYGLTHFTDLFTDRQIDSIELLATEIKSIESLIERDIERLKESSLENQAENYQSYADAIITYLGLALSGLVDRMSTLCVWDPGGKGWGTKLNHVFARQALPMTWGFAEGNPFGDQTGSYLNSLSYTAKGISTIGMPGGTANSGCATEITDNSPKIISTDPPYFDMISYADLSDFFYIWLRKCLKEKHPKLFATISAPRSSEIVAATYRHGGKERAGIFFESQMFEALKSIRKQAHPGFPVTLYYAFKQSETKSTSGSSTTGWEAFLSSLINAGFSITATWPIRTELSNRMNSKNANTLASSIVIACRPRDRNANRMSKSEFKRRLKSALEPAIQNLERENIAPVDIAQAAIGPGMSIFSSASAVFNADDSSMSVREALHEISVALEELLALDETNLDNETLFAITFFESYGYEERPYGDAEGLAVARNISVQGVTEAGILSAIGGKSQLLRREQLQVSWDPFQDNRLCVWEATQHLIRALDSGGEASAAALLAQLKNLPGQVELASNCRALAYRLYNHCEKTKQTEEARAYNGLVIAWPELERLASSQASESAVQTSLI